MCGFFRSGTGCIVRPVITSELAAMKTHLRFASLVLARIKQRLHALKQDLGQWVPQPAPVLVPIPIPAERRPRQSDRRHPARAD
jgi:hypothetical protein